VRALENSPVRLELASSDVATARETLEGPFASGRFDASAAPDRPFAFRHVAVGDTAMTLRETRFSGHLGGGLAPHDEYVVAWMQSGTGSFTEGRDETTFTQGVPVLLPLETDYSFAFDDFVQKCVHFRTTDLERVAAEREGAAPGRLHFDRRATPSPAALRAWWNTLALVSRTVTDPEVSPLLASEMSRLAAVALLQLYPYRSADLPPQLQAPRNARMRTAVEHVHANAHLPITSTDIAQAAGLSLRALQEGFQRTFDLAPRRAARRGRGRAAPGGGTPSGPGRRCAGTPPAGPGG
jgi:hypothetical protein